MPSIQRWEDMRNVEVSKKIRTKQTHVIRKKRDLPFLHILRKEGLESLKLSGNFEGVKNREKH